MKKTTARVRIVPTDELSTLHLAGLCGRCGTVTEQVFSTAEKLIGYMVLLDKSFQGEYLWFIPEDAVEDAQDN
ncbi:hypothetical protein [Alistipes sp. i18-0019-D1]|uniref:hypothetical protein n=1 Tax=Alistipes sp. i18-0019-D1 TaxID=3132707 RepID=UPI0036F37946